MIYDCKICEYNTNNKSNYNRHLKSSRHLQNLQESSTLTKKRLVVSKALQTIFVCKYCNNEFTRASSLTRHKKVCADVEINKREAEMKINVLESQVKELKEFITSGKAAPTYNISVKKLVQQNYPDAPHIAMLKNYAVIHEDEDIDLTQDLIYFHNKNKLNSYLGDIIIKYYKKEDPKDQSLWSTDSSRLKYIIKELLASKKSSWSEDDKGLKINKYVIDPLLEYIHEYINEQIDKLDEALPDSIAVECIRISQKQLDLAHIREQIQNGQLKDSINKYIAPSFRFNSDKLISIS